MQRWANNDPIGESGFAVLRFHNSNPLWNIALFGRLAGNNLSEFASNDPIIRFDPLGLTLWFKHSCTPTELPSCTAQCVPEGGVKSCIVWEEIDEQTSDIVSSSKICTCNSPPQNPPVSPFCPDPFPAPPRRLPPTFWPIVGIGVGIAVLCTVCPICCGIGVIAA